MNTKEAIEVLETEIWFYKKDLEFLDINNQTDEIKRNNELIIEYKQIIKLLKRGENYRQMWESMVNASKCLIDPKGRKVLKMVVKDIKQGMKESEKYLKEGKR